MKKIEIYQIQYIADCNYAFRSWDEAKDKFSMNDYTKVAEYEVEDKDDDYILNDVWNEGNNGELQSRFHNMYSVSMSNIIVIGGKKYYVDTFGFKEVE